MLNTLFLILKIVGMVLLCIIGILLLLLIMLMFVPVRYKGNVSKENGEDNPVYALGKVSWLMHIISAAFEYKEGSTELIIKVFGIRIRSGEERRERKRRREEKRRRKRRGEKVPDEQTEYTIYEYNKDGVEIKTESGVKKSKTSVFTEEHDEGLDIEYPPDNSKPSDMEDSKEDNYRADKEDRICEEDGEEPFDPFMKFTEKAGRILKKLGVSCEKLSKGLQRTADRIGDTIDNIDYYHTALCNDSNNREALTLLTVKLKRLLKAVRPRKVKGRLSYGSKDPSSTGMVLAGAAVLYPWYGRNIVIEPDFYNEVLAFDLFLKGRIYLCVAVKILLQLYFNKKVRRFIRIMKKENSANG